MTIALVSRTDEREVRSEKILHSLTRRGYHCLFVGWNRLSDGWQPEQAVWERRVWLQPAGTGVGAAKHLFRFRQFVGDTLRQHPVQLAIGVNEEVVYLLKNWRGRYFSKLLLDTHDELDTRVRTANPLLQATLSYVAGQARDSADAIFCVHPHRREAYHPAHQLKTVTLRNYPTDVGELVWNRIPQGEFRIFAGGALSRQRGLEFLLKAAERTAVPIVSAGRLMDDYARNIFCRHPLVRYRGCLSVGDAMAQLADCHASVAFYAPGPRINCLAAPNKVYDAVCVGRPILISDETEVADWVERNRTGLRVRYGDVEGLAAQIQALKANQSELPSFAVRARELFREGYSWESQEPVLYSAVHNALRSVPGAAPSLLKSVAG